ncbi:MAG: DNA mismatch repair endonuclease MutL [Bacteroidia bacterium]|nr:DNA mismatch repair endonuclease MutL [Bacteroidia bacterium]
MQDSNNIIHVLQDSVANKIAAGEVVQRPASVVKELVENAIDAGADKIIIRLKDAGRTLIQVIDNGKGMSPTDAVTAFDRHATSKIQTAEDLFSLHTMGFRGEALSSIAAVSHIKMDTRRKEDDLGYRISFTGGTLYEQEFVNCSLGTNIMVRDLFFNIPARRKFLKSNETEFRNILNCFQQIALVYPNIAFELYNNDAIAFELPIENQHQRIVSLFGKRINQQLLRINVETLLVNISGFIGLPEFAQKRNANQYFFVNGRYIQHPYFNRAVSAAYEKIIPQDHRASYFIYFEVDPSKIDVNIHPTKTEVKFEDESSIFPIITAVIKEALGKANVTPSINFDQEDAPSIPILNGDIEYVAPPKVSYNPQYNPFAYTNSESSYSSKKSIDSWDKLYKNNSLDNNTETKIETSDDEDRQYNLDYKENENTKFCGFQLFGKFLVQADVNGIKITNHQRAHIRILYENFVSAMTKNHSASQKLLFPEILELSAIENSMFAEIREDLCSIGFMIEDFGKNAYQIIGIPAQMEDCNPVQLIHDTITAAQETPNALVEDLQETIALDMAKHISTRKGNTISTEDASYIMDSLKKCSDQIYTPDGKHISYVLTEQEINKHLQ